MNNILLSVEYLLNGMADSTLTKPVLLKRLDAPNLQADYYIVATFNHFTNRGYGQFLLRRSTHLAGTECSGCFFEKPMLLARGL